MRGSIARGRLLLVVLFAVAVLAPGAAVAQTAAQEPEGRQDENEGLLQRLDAARVSRNPETGTVSLIGANNADPIERPAGLSPGASPTAAARAHLQKVGPVFGIQDPSSEAELQDTEAVGKGRSVTHFRQVHEGVPVLGGEINVQTNDSNELLSAAGEALPNISLDTEPGVKAGEASDTALEATAKQYERGAGSLDVTEPKLWIFDPTLLGGPGLRTPRLVWRMDVTPKGFDDFRELVLVDAQLGNVALNFNQIHTVKSRDTHDSDNTSALPGTLVCNEANPCTDPSYDNDVQLAHRYAGETYDFYWTQHNRDSLNNAGMKMISTADYCDLDPAQPCPYQNAFWNGTQMAYGDGFAAADDVVGHELTHGVTDFESSLFYYYQSGAINESLSDVWGEFVDLTNTSGTDTATTRWQMGEDIPGFGAQRDMENPPLFNHPDRMQSPLYFADANEQDGGGVHLNSGVNNKAAFLLTDGGTFNGRTVTGLGIPKTAKIYYEAQTNLLTSASDYSDLHGILRQACATLVGTSGITAADCTEVADAVDATEMNLQPTNAPAPEAPVCPTGQNATNLFSDDLENTASGNWTKQNISGLNHWHYPQPAGWEYATSGQTNFLGYNQPATADYAIARTANVTPPASKTTYLRFNHAHGFQDDVNGAYDGGVLEYSTNNGTSWTDAGSLFTDNGYTGTISSLYGNPLGGRQAFVRESNGYISSRANLSSLAGQNVRFRFRIGTDSALSDYGWFIDDVRVYTCEGPNTPPVANDDSYNVNEDQTLTVADGPNDLLANDTDADANNLTAALLAAPSHGTVSLNANGSFTYTSNANYSGPDSFTYRANDGTTNSNTATVSITVNPVNDAPTFTKGTDQTVNEDSGAQTVAGWASAISAGPSESGQNVSFVVTNDTSALFSSQPEISSGGQLTYTPAAEKNGSATITVRAKDDNGTPGDAGDDVQSAAQTFTITVNPVNDAPSFTRGTDQTVDEDSGARTVSPWATSISRGPSDESGQGVDFVITDNTNSALFSSQPSVADDGTLGFTPAANESGTATITLRIQDDGGTTNGGVDQSATQRFTITVNAVNDGPDAANDTYNVDEDDTLTVPAPGVLGNDTDIDGGGLSAARNGGPSNGTLTLDADGSFVYTPNADFNGTDSFTYNVSDGNGGTATATVNLTVNAVNDAPAAEADTKTTAEDTPLAFPSSDLVTNDDEGAANESGQTLSVTEVFNGTHGTVGLGPDGNITFTPEVNFNGDATFTYRVCDNGSPSECSIETATVNVTISPVNDAPVAEDLSVTTNEDTAKEVTLGAADVEGDNLSYTILSGPAHGTLTGSGANQTYTPNNNYNGIDSFTFKANDGTDDSNTATVNITVNAVNDAPDAVNDPATTNEDTATDIDVLANDTDVDNTNAQLSVSSVGAASHGTATKNADGTIKYAPDPDYNGADSFTYDVSDGNGGTDTARVDITVAPVDDTPPDNTRPTIVSVNPPAGKTGVSRLANITVTFSEEMNPATLNANTVKLVKSGTTASVPLTMTVSTNTSGGDVLKLDPFGPTTQKLGKSATYKLTVEGAADTDGLAVEDTANNELAQDKLSSFKTKRR